MIRFIKTPTYETAPTDQDVFNYLELLGRQQIDPPPKDFKKLIIQADTIFYSPARRVKEGCFFATKNSFEIFSLREILFDLKKLTTKDNWLQNKSQTVRAEFKKAFIKDRLPVKRKIIFQEIKEVLARCLLESPEKEIAIVSHSFRLKIMESFIKTAGRIENQPELLHEYLKDSEKTYQFGEGFSISRKDLPKATKKTHVLIQEPKK